MTDEIYCFRVDSSVRVVNGQKGVVCEGCPVSGQHPRRVRIGEYGLENCVPIISGESYVVRRVNTFMVRIISDGGEKVLVFDGYEV